MHPPATPARPRPRLPTALTMALGALVGVVLAAAIFVAASWPRSTVERRFRQPASVVYSDHALHWVVVRHRRSLAGSLTGHVRTEFWIGSDPGGRYGHPVELDATGMDPDRVEVVWKSDAVVLLFRTGHEVRVPAQSFIGGR